MSEEEKKAIDRVMKSYDDNTGYYELEGKDWCLINHLIEKQQIELDNSISKNKIREVRNTFDEMVQKMYAGKRELTDHDVFILFEKLLEERN